ncbi:hypothetical protein PFICI_07920 [Pestalotiopsis fici W106-1]|uniref:Protein kinase domain-containing protein n=1 Tax=Pestalotiopsis fici (strain W106-1 / CGMCC3.15140) TaxID=1229662 RepID=W3X5C6_PESFW|nr:uncharacterized protein PFICI_07920 [Pestalotiopsis fici W106-1]ETS80391.1 hypothetical protein PFICI_07920 [Pestalotiopsis fici W106-1]
MDPSDGGAQSYIDALCSQIRNSLVKSTSGQSFLPNDKLHEIFSFTTIQRAVENLNCKIDDRISLSSTIHNEGKRVFAMLIYSRCPDQIVEFRKHRFLDSRLPLSEVDAERIVGKHVGYLLFDTFQWIFCPYEFSKTMCEHHHEIQKGVILPFISVEPVGNGAFGEVKKVNILASQQDFMDAKAIALKKLNSGGATEWLEREKSCLRLLNRLEHPNIIPFLGSYTYLEDNYLLFHYIDLDLWKFLSAQVRYGDFKWDCTFYSSLAGLASALSTTHNFHLTDVKHGIDLKATGYHHDLRPPNVLVGPDTFLLADFGLGKVKPENVHSNTGYKATCGDYIAPECTDVEENPNTVGRAIDVWAFGCLLIDVVTYMLKGPSGVEEFRAKRLMPARLPQWKDSVFYQPEGDLKQEVRQWIEDLIRDQPDSVMPRQLLEISTDSLQREPRNRPSMDTLHQRLSNLSIRKYFSTILDTFQETYKLEEQLHPQAQRHLEGLRYAQTRFKIWGNTLSQHNDIVSAYGLEQIEMSMDILKNILRMMERSQRDIRTDGSGNKPLVRSINSLWDLLPGSLRRSADFQWQQETKSTEIGHSQNAQDQSDAIREVELADGPSVVDNHLASQFELAARTFEKKLPKPDLWVQILEVTSVSDLYTITDSLQEEQRQNSGLRNLSKIQLYLKRLEGFANIISDVVSKSRNVLAVIWGPLALLLQWAKTLDYAFDCLLGAFAEVGKRLPDFMEIDQSSATKEILFLFFKDLIDIYLEILKPFNHPKWMHVFESFWPRYELHIQEIVCHVERHTRLMGNNVQIQAEEEFRNRALESFRDQRLATTRQEFNRIKTSFSPSRYDNKLYRLRDLRCQGPADWLFDNTTFSKWINGVEQEPRILWIKGIPGAGKTFLSSAVVSRFQQTTEAMTAFAFLTYEEAETTALSTIHSLIFQLAEKHEDLRTIICESTSEALRSDLSATGKLLSDLIHCAGPVYLVIDGIDEISEAERGRLIAEVGKIAEICVQARIILSSRPEADIVRGLGDAVTTITIQDHNEASIESYIRQRSQEIFSERQMPKSALKSILELLSPLASQAKGMFLYARLVMDMVSSMNDLSEMEEQFGVLPENLDDAQVSHYEQLYYRIIQRLGQQKDKKQAQRARRLLGWIASSPIPMSVEEATQALMVNPDKRDQVFNIMVLDVVKMLGPIVETVDTHIHFVHFTAKEYIVSPHLGTRVIDSTEATLSLALCCINYLCQSHHDSDVTPEEISKKVLTGQYGFHSFSSIMWFDLVCQYFQMLRSANPSIKLIQSIQRLFDTRKTDHLASTEQHHFRHGDPFKDSFAPLKAKQPLLYALLLQAFEFRQASFLFTGKTDQDPKKNHNDPLSISATSQRIRQSIDGALCNSALACLLSSKSEDHTTCEDILYYYGPRPFKCKFPLCKFWRHGFPTRGLRYEHEKSHDVLLQCDEPGCVYKEIGFLSERMRRLHSQTAHRNTPAYVPQRSFDGQELSVAEVETILSDLIKHDEIERVREVLGLFPNALDEGETRHKLQLLAASNASGNMLQLLENPINDGGLDAEERKEAHACIAASIRGRNASALEHFCSRFGIHLFSIDKMYSRKDGKLQRLWLTRQLASTEWREGVEIWCTWLQGFRQHDKTLNNMLKRLIDPSILSAAASHPAGDQQLLDMWRKLRIFPIVGPRCVNQALKNVAGSGLSILLATYLLDLGADVNDRRKYKITALHRAAQHASAKGAEMMRLLLLHGADPDLNQEAHTVPQREGSDVLMPGRRIQDEKGAKAIHQWLGMSWDELVEDTKQKQVGAGKQLIEELLKG